MPPTMLMDALQAVRRRVKFLGVAYGVGIAVALAVGLLLFTVLADYLLNLPAWPRFVLFVAALGGIAYAIARWIWVPASKKLSLSDVAGRLEQTFPQFEDRLRSTVDFASSGGGGAAHGSDIMQRRVMSEAAEMAGRLDLGSAIVVKPVWYSAGAAAGALLLAMILAMLAPTYAQIGLARLLNPFGAPSWPKRVQIAMIGNAPQRVPVGQRFDLRMKLAKGDRASTKALVHYQLDGGPVQQEYMTRGPDGVYVASLDAKADPARTAGVMKVWMTAGDDQKHVEPITVLPRLTIARVEAVLTPPAYVGDSAKPATINLAEGPAIAAAGSEVALRVVFNKNLADSVPVQLKPLAADAKSPQIAWERAGEGTVIGKWSAAESVRFHVLATDTDGFTNAGLEEYEVIVRPDQNPTVQIENPRRNEERTPIAAFPLQGVAEDDYGISSMKLVVDRLGDKKHWEIPLVANARPEAGVTWNRIEGSGDRLRLRGNYTWDLAKLDSAGLKPGDVLEYHLQVQDNYSLNNQTHAPVPSGKLRITIVSQEQLADMVTAEMRQAAAAIKDVHARQDRTKQETGDLARETEKKPNLDGGDKAVAERLGNQQGTAAAQAKQVAGKLEAVQQRMEENKSPANDLKQLAGDVKDLLNNVAEKPMKDAAARIASAAQQQNDPGKRAEDFKSANAEQQRATDQLAGAMDRMGSVGSLAQTIDKLRDLLKAQQEVSKATADAGAKNLGKKPEQMNDDDRKKLDKAAEDQANLAKKTDKAMADMQKTAEQMAKSDPASSEAMKQAAKTGQSQQVSPNQSKAANAAKQNQQAQAQSAQKQAELGLQMMLNNLREAERRKLEELSKKLTELQQQLATLIRRQSGHNLDNLGLQGKTVDKLAKDLAESLLAMSERPKDKAAQAQLPQLTQGQEQTERNARDIAQSVEQMPNGAEPAANLTRAASRMERAIVGLRGKDLPGAYEPPQIDALAALIEAKQIVDKQKNEVEQKKEEQQKEAVRAAYAKIKTEQEKINAETARIDKAPKADDGNLNRPDAIRLGQLPAEQGKLADRTQELEEALAAVNSVVYIWANKDIVTSMNGVKADLGKPATGVPTQAEEARIVEQLDAMIKHLEIKQLDKKFEQRNQGGGGGGGGGECGPKLPTEAELRLLKDLQKAINNSTRKIDGEKPKDEPKLLALGGRQGELRNLLDQMIQKTSQGQAKLRPEPDNKDQLPEEASKDQVEQQELEQVLQGDAPNAEQIEKDLLLVGDRMARSRQRLAINNDPGKTTQVIQERILKDLDSLIEQSRRQQATASAQPKPGQPQQPGQKMQQPNAGQRQVAQNTGGKVNGPAMNKTSGSNPKPNSISPGQSGFDTDLSQQIKESAAEWGRISPRTRNAVIEGADEQIMDKYKRYVEDYYKGVAVKGAERQ